MNRRDVLRGAVLASALVALPGVTLRRMPAATEVSLASRLCGLFRHPESASIVGGGYLALAPGEADAAVLIDLISGTSENYRQLLHADTPTLRALLVAQQRDEFRRQRTVSVNGWVLSETEARLCALAALEH